MPKSTRAAAGKKRMREDEESQYRRGPVSKSQRWRDGQRDDNHDQTPSKLHQGPSGDGTARHRNRSPDKSGMKGRSTGRIEVMPSDDSVSSHNTTPDESTSGSEVEEQTTRTSRTRVSQDLSNLAVGPTKTAATGPSRVSRVQTPNAPRRPSKSASASATKRMSSNNGHANDRGEDEDMCKDVHGLIGRIAAFAEGIPDISKDQSKSGFYNQLLDNPDNKQLIRYIGCLALGGPSGKNGWQELLSDHDCRKALVVGIVGRALKEHVFGSLLFGAEEKYMQQLQEMEQDLKDLDGFHRSKELATKIKEFDQSVKNLDEFIKTLTAQLCKMLGPFWEPGTSGAGLRKELSSIVEEAVDISHIARTTPDVVYYWPPTFKDEEFEPSRMECFNLDDMITNSPYDKKKVQGNFERAILRSGEEHRSEAIVRVVCFPGLVAYRQFGGDLALKEVAAEQRKEKGYPEDVQRSRRYGEQLDPNNGFRSKVICKSLVHLQWGKQRLLTREAGTSAHIDAVKNGNMKKYADDSKTFVELYDDFKKRHPNI